MREIRQSGSEGGEAELNRPSLPLSIHYPLPTTHYPLPTTHYDSAGLRTMSCSVSGSYW